MAAKVDYNLGICISIPNERVLGRNYSESELEVRTILLALFSIRL
jgi:hypothetical protein